MDKNLPKDPLEDFFKKSLEGLDDQPSDDGWDLPSSDIWDRVEEKIVPQPVVRVMNYWKWTAIAASVALLIFSYQFFNQNQQIENLTTELENNSQELESVKELLQDQTESKSSAIKEENQHSIVNHQTETPILKEGEKEDFAKSSIGETEQAISEAPSFSKNNGNGIGGKNNSDTAPIPSIKNSMPLVFEEEYFSKTDQNNLEENRIVENSMAPVETETELKNTVLVDKEKKIQESILELPKRVFALTNNQNKAIEKINLLPTAIIDLIPPKSKTGFYAGFYGSRNQGDLKICGEDSPQAKSRKDWIKNSRQTEVGTLGAGLKLGYRINDRWSIESGLQYSKLVATTEHQIEKQYTSTGQQMQNGEFENEYPIILITSIGDVSSDVTLSRSSSLPMIPEQTPFQLDIESTQSISFLGIPILAKYSMGNTRFNIALKAGVLANFILDSDFEVKKINQPLSVFRHRSHRIRDKREIKNLNGRSLNALFGLEAEMKLNESTYLSLEPSFSRSINPIFEKEEVKTYPMMASLKLGVNYRF